ncbi:unnamed protein product, partial [Thlaspi arvense]
HGGSLTHSSVPDTAPGDSPNTDGITAPGDSPNTDGIKLGFSSNIHISNTVIGTGDNCIAILSRNTNMDISNVKCGPRHGIIVGSLGKNKDENDVTELTIQDLKLKNIYGTSKNKVAVNLQCSKSSPCKNVVLIDINIEHNGVDDGPSTAVCENVDGSAHVQ